MHPMMKCGHAANATKDGKPCCVICFPDPSSDIVDDNPESLDGREAKCLYCGTGAESSPELAFFESRPEEPYDRFYCGCRGWD